MTLKNLLETTAHLYAVLSKKSKGNGSENNHTFMHRTSISNGGRGHSVVDSTFMPKTLFQKIHLKNHHIVQNCL